MRLINWYPTLPPDVTPGLTRKPTMPPTALGLLFLPALKNYGDSAWFERKQNCNDLCRGLDFPFPLRSGSYRGINPPPQRLPAVVRKSYFVSHAFRICIVLVALLATSGLARSQNMQLEYEVPKIVLDSPVDLPANFWERFKFSFEQNAEQVFTDRFHSLNTTQWYMALADRNAAEIRDATSRAARRLFPFRDREFSEASFDLPIMLWLEGSGDSGRIWSCSRWTPWGRSSVP